MNMRPDNHEAAMARADLYKLANYSFKLFKMIHDGDELEGWVQAKVTKAADYIASVYHYMEYEMKFSEYGDQLENSDVYSEAVKQEFKKKLTEAKEKLSRLKQVHEEDLKKVGDTKKTPTGELTKTSTGVVHKRTDFSDEEHGQVNKTHAKSKSASEKKDRAPAQKQSKSGTWGMKDGSKFDNRNKKVKEGIFGDSEEDLVKKSPQLQALIALRKDPKYQSPEAKAGLEARIKKQMDRVSLDKGEVMGADGKPIAVKEALKGGQKKLDVDKDGKLEKSDFAKLRSSKNVKEAAKPDFLDMDKDGNKKEPMKKAVADKKKNPFAKVKEGTATCNESPKGKSCPVHGLKECGSMYEESHQEKTTMKHVKNPTAGEKKAAKDIKPGVAGYRDRIDMLKSAEKDGRLKERATGDYSAKKGAAGKDLGKPGKNFAKIADKAGKAYGSKERGEKVAGAVLAKLRKG
jgi:hypothetical protein